MKDVLVVLFIVIFLVGVLVGTMITSKDYRNGQIDAIMGRVQYHLVTDPTDSTSHWEKIK